MLDKNILLTLQQFNNQLKSDTYNNFKASLVRERLETKGKFKKANKLPPSKLLELTNEKAILAVDGSRIEYGSFYPYLLAFFRTLAGTTNNIFVEDSQIISPLIPEIQKIIEEFAKENNISEEDAYKIFLRNSLAQMELRTALKLVKDYKPHILMLDGGFLLFDKFPEWQLLVEECVNNNIILVGIIEEIATAEIAPMLNILSYERPRIYDREILFGLLEKSEYFNFHPENKIKKNYATVFARLSTSPQAVAVDFLGEQDFFIDDSMNIINTLTPNNGQGIPAWLQLIDAKVRLRKKDIDKILYTCLDRDIIEKYFIPNRERRIY